MNFTRYYHTVRDLKARQWRYQVIYRLRKRFSRRTGKRPVPAGKDFHYVIPRLAPVVPSIMSMSGEVFTFLNIPGRFKGWNDLSHGKLWAYNLNYMDFLLQENIDPRLGFDWIRRFIDDSAVNRCGYEPYPISLRGINWIKFLSLHAGYADRPLLDRVSRSLYAQYRILYGSVEYHLLGNHLLENGFSLLFGGIYFSDKRLYSRGEKIVGRELEEQILADGAHFERSPMYHAIILGRLLDAINLLSANTTFSSQPSLLKLMRSKASLMLGWIDAIRYDEGDFPLLNDAASRIAYTPQQLAEYAARSGISWKRISPGISGYRKVSGTDYQCIVDTGPIGPAYIPGHAHADTLGFVLRIAGKDIIRDTGISTYEKNERRQYERSTDAHNTVVVNDRNSSDVWGGFRVGRKAGTRILSDSAETITAVHDGYRNIGITHTRSWKFSSRTIVVTDRLETKKAGYPGHGYAVFHLDAEARITKEGIRCPQLKITFKNGEHIETAPARVSREYNKFEESVKIRVYFSGTLETRLEII